MLSCHKRIRLRTEGVDGTEAADLVIFVPEPKRHINKSGTAEAYAFVS